MFVTYCGASVVVVGTTELDVVGASAVVVGAAVVTGVAVVGVFFGTDDVGIVCFVLLAIAFVDFGDCADGMLEGRGPWERCPVAGFLKEGLRLCERGGS